jgi:hypothetical protein
MKPLDPTINLQGIQGIEEFVEIIIWYIQQNLQYLNSMRQVT